MADFDTPAITLDEILKNLPPVDPALFATYFADAQALVAVGVTIASSKVVTDTRRVYADAYLFWKDASPPQQQRLRGSRRSSLRSP